MDDEVRFAAGLFRGTAEYYDRYRLPIRTRWSGIWLGAPTCPGAGVCWI
jgi:hypothetical protein